MLCINNYSKKHITVCCAKVAAQVSAYQNLITIAKKQTPAGESSLNNAIENFEPHFFNNLVLTLGNYFVNRTKAKEMKGEILN